MYPSLFQSILQPNPLSPPNYPYTSIPKKRIPPFHPHIDDQTGLAQPSKKLKTSKQPSELFADIADNLFSYYSDLGNMKKTYFPFQIQFPQIFEDHNDLLSQAQTQSQSSSSNFEQMSHLFSSQDSSLQNSAQKSIRSLGHNHNMIKEEEAETASKGRSFASSGIMSNSTRPKKKSKEIFKITRQDKYGFVLERKLEFDVKSKNQSPLKKSGKSSVKQPEVSQKQDELKNRLEDILKQAQSLLDNMKETATQITQETPKKETIHVKHEIVSQETQISEKETKIEPKIEEDQMTLQIIRPQLFYVQEPINHEEIKRNPEIRVGEAFQADIKNILREKNQQPEVKLIWNPEKFSEEELAEYYKRIKKIIKMDLICEDKALKVLTMMEGNVELALNEIKENSKYYMSHLKVNMRTLRSQNSIY